MIIRNILIGISLGLSLLVIVQWTRESGLRRELSAMDVRVMTAEAETSDLRDKLRSWGEEISRLTELNKTAVVKEAEQKEEIARLTGILQARDAAQAAEVPADYAATLKARNEEVLKQNEATARQNEAITKANAALQKLVRERDDIVEKLNGRTRELNELTQKYNKLAK